MPRDGSRLAKVCIIRRRIIPDPDQRYVCCSGLPCGTPSQGLRLFRREPRLTLCRPVSLLGRRAII